MRRHEVHCLDRGDDEPESLFLSVSSLGFIRGHSSQQTMHQIFENNLSILKSFAAQPSGIWHIPSTPWLRWLWKGSFGAKAVWPCGASFSWKPLLCSAPWRSPELCCWYITAQFNTFQILTLIPLIQLFSLVSHPSCPFVLFDQFELWDCMGFFNL